jgi:hypothetical protein
MKHSFRKWMAWGVVGLVVLGVVAPGCSNRLGPVRATQSSGSVDNPNLPNIMLEHSKECMELDGRQLGSGRTVLPSTVTLDEDGDIVSVDMGVLSETARDFGTCMRNVFRDMPIAKQPFQEGVQRLNFHLQHANDSDEALRRFIEVIPGVPIVESELVLEADGYTAVLPVTVKVVDEKIQKYDLDEAILKKIGQMALNSVGYDEIVRRAKQEGWVKTVRKVQPKAPAGKGLISQTETEVVVVMFEVFTTHAVTAGVVSQLDSPLPGPADLAAIGILSVGLYKVGALGLNALITATAPAPTSAPPPPPPPPQPPPPPPPNCPRNEKFVPERTDNSMGCTDKKGNIRCYSRRHSPCVGVHTHGILHFQEVRRGICTPVHSKAVRCEGTFTVSGPCDSVPTVECGAVGSASSGVFED